MANVRLKDSDLLEAVARLGPEEFDAFLDRALSARKQSPGARLPARESRLIQRINRGIPDDILGRYDELARKRKRNSLTELEHAELLRLTHQIESQDAERAGALLELAKLRQVPFRVLMKQMGIKPAPVHG